MFAHTEIRYMRHKRGINAVTTKNGANSPLPLLRAQPYAMTFELTAAELEEAVTERDKDAIAKAGGHLGIAEMTFH